MKSARSYPLDSASSRPEKHRPRHHRPPIKRRIHSSVSAGPTILTMQPSNRTHRVSTTLDQKPQICNSCSASADVSSTSSISISPIDSAEPRDAGDHVTCGRLENIMHAKHKVIRRAREQMIKLANNDHLPPLQNDPDSPLQTNFLPIRVEPKTSRSTKQINSNQVDYDLDCQYSISENIYREDVSPECFDQNDCLSVRGKDHHEFDENMSMFSERKQIEPYGDDSRTHSVTMESKFNSGEFSPSQLDRKRCSSNDLRYSSVNRQYTRKINKFSVPFTIDTRTGTGNNERSVLHNTIADTDIGYESSPRESSVPSKMEGHCSRNDIRVKKLNVRSELGQETFKHGFGQTISVPSARMSIKPSTANAKLSVKTFYENPYLKQCSGSSMLPVVTESQSDHVLESTSRSTNTTPVARRTQSTNTTILEESVDLRFQKTPDAVGKICAKPSQNFQSPFHVIQPLLFVLAVFTVSMSGAYVGVMVASAAYNTSNVECEPGILQWLFSSRRHVRAF